MWPLVDGGTTCELKVLYNNHSVQRFVPISEFGGIFWAGKAGYNCIMLRLYVFFIILSSCYKYEGLTNPIFKN